MFRDDFIKEFSLVYINRGAKRHSFIFLQAAEQNLAPFLPQSIPPTSEAHCVSLPIAVQRAIGAACSDYEQSEVDRA